MFKYVILTIISGLLILTSCQKKTTADQPARKTREVVELPLQNPDARVLTYNQITRKNLVQEIIVPTEMIYSDVFRQQEVLPPVIDILVVIDNSYSMEEEQANLSDKLTALLSDLNEVDWQIMVITTDNTCRRIPELPLKPDTPEMVQLFQKAVKAGINGSGSEIALKNVVDHLKPNCTRDPRWKREHTDLAVLIVSDEDEDDSSKYHLKSDLFIKDLEAMSYTPGKNLKVYGIIGHPESVCPDVEAPSVTYADVIKGTNGLWGSICAPDYTATLSAISRDIRTNLKVEFPLRFAPILSTIKLDLDGSAYSGDWTIIGQSLVLADALPEGSTLTVKYQVESFRLLNLGVNPADYLLDSIRLDGELIDTKMYNYDPDKNTVLLTFDPTAGARIQTKLIENKPLTASFPFPDVVTKRLACFIDNREMSATYKVDRQTISFTPAPPAGTVVHCLYEL